MFALVDGNNFFVSCERAFDPRLEGRPVAVLSNNDGCCISRSNEFKALGIPMGTPFFKLRDQAERGGIVLLSGNYELYGDLSRRVMEMLRDFSPDVDQYSVDEAFVSVDLGHDADYYSYGMRMRSAVLRCVGIPCGIGFAPTKTLAKIANHIAKKSRSGVFVLPNDPTGLLCQVPIADVWGVGHRLAPQLVRMGIRNAAELAGFDLDIIDERFGIVVRRIASELRGEPMLSHGDFDEPRHSIACSRSFGTPITDYASMRESVATYLASAATRLRAAGKTAAGVNVYMEYCREFSPVPLDGGMRSGTIVFDRPLASTGEMLSEMSSSLERMFLPGRRYRKSGVVLFGLESADAVQGDFFSNPAADELDNRVYETLDAINRRFGHGAMSLLAEGTDKPWKMKRDRLSRRYTTDWDELLCVK
ncbi:MAG: Y-family DNA polymerase [Victivallaceae bacterium]|nr:Y-family DNA polymerase [Victivallaceae bacterium]